MNKIKKKERILQRHDHLRMPASAVPDTKLASSTLSPESARARRIPSAENVSMASVKVMKLPVDLAIFSEFSSRCPFALGCRI